VRSVYSLTVDEVLEFFRKDDREVQQRGNYYLTQCPCHDDGRPSLKIMQGDKKPVVLTCFAGCEQTDVWDWVEEQYSPNGAPSITITKKKQEPGKDPVLTLSDYAAYLHMPVTALKEMGLVQIQDGIGFPFAETAMKVRRIRNGERSFRWESGAASQFPLYPMPPDTLPEEIWICEGETDGLVARFMGLEAFGTTSGSSAMPGHLTVKHFAALKTRGVTTVVVVPHVDDTGQKAMDLLTISAQAAGLDVELCDLVEEEEDPFITSYRPKDLHEWVLFQEDDIDVAAVLRTKCVTQINFKHSEGLGAFERHADEQVDWVIPEFAATGDVIGIVAPPKNLKTYFALTLLHSLCSGEPFLRRGGMTPTRKFKVMVVEEEGHQVHLANRMRRVAQGYGTEALDDSHGRIRLSSGFLLDDDSVAGLIAEMQFYGIEVLILDPWQRIIQSGDESSASETAADWDQIFHIRKETGATIFVIHHMRKDSELTPDGIRGSSRFRGEVDASILLKYDADELTLLMVVEGRDIPYAAGEAHPVKVIWNEEYQDVFALDGVEFEETVSITMKKGATSDSNKQKVLDALKSSGEWMSKKEIEMATGFSKDTVSRHLNHLVEDGTVHLDPDASGPGKASKYQAT
jgi:hypothetical protein